MPLSKRQVRELTAATARELAWGLPQMNRITREWSRLAERIPDEPIRIDAIKALDSKRGHLAGAVAFTIIPGKRNRQLLQAVLSHQAIVDYLDTAHERHPTVADGERLHLAVVEALNPGDPISDYYAEHPWQNDGGYLRTLVEDCRRQCEALPSFASVQPLLTLEAERSRRVLTLNHLPDPAARDAALRRVADEEFPDQKQWQWFEVTAALCGQLGFFALLALATKPDVDEAEIAATHDAYWPLMPCLANMLDSFADQTEDVARGNHQYIAHYEESDRVDRISELIAMAGERLVALPDGQRHAVILSCMVALYLTKDSARTPAMTADAKQLGRAGGTLPQALMPVLRTWRLAYSQAGL
jgi:tetraprenyl-beta-curcumene synthase